MIAPCSTPCGGLVIRFEQRSKFKFGRATFLRGLVVSSAIAGLLGVLLFLLGSGYLGWQQERRDKMSAAELTFLEQEAAGKNIAAYAQLIGTSIISDRAYDRRQIVWLGQRHGQDLRTLAGDFAGLTIPGAAPPGIFETIAIPQAVRAPSRRVSATFPVRGLVKQISLADGQALLFVGRDMRPEKSFVRNAVVLGALFLLTVGGTLFLSALFTVRYVARRIEQIAFRAAEISDGDISQRIPQSERNDEFDAIARVINQILDRAERLLSGMKEVTDNVAHDLRTPLNRLRTRVELALTDFDKDPPQGNPKQALEFVLQEADGLLATFSALLSIARLESGAMRDSLNPVELSEIIRGIAELYGPHAEDRGIKLEFSVAPGLKIWSNKALLMQAISNLVDNAVKYSPDGGKIYLGAQRVPESEARGRIDIFVEDEGPGIPDADRARVLERFVRLDVSRGLPGNGLGLSLVAAIARLHEAPLMLETGRAGKGLRVRLRFAAA